MPKNNILIRSKIKKAQLLLQENKLDEAKLVYEQLIKTNKTNAELYLNLIVIYRRMNLLDQAELLCKKLIQFQPNNSAAHHIYGSIKQLINDYTSAINYYHKAIELDPSNFEASYLLGNAFQLTGHPKDAEQAFKKAINLKPEFLEALCNLGAVSIELRKLNEAHEYLNKANKLRPNCEQVLCNLGDLSIVEHRLDDAISFAEVVLKINPNFFDAINLLGKAYCEKGDYTKALEYFYNALKIKPGDENIVGEIAQILEMRREYQQALDLIQPYLDTDTTNSQILLVYSALSRHFKTIESATNLLEHAVANNNYLISQKIKIYSELGKQYDKLGTYSLAFEHYKLANDLERSLINNNQISIENIHDRQKIINCWQETYDSNFWGNLARSSNNSKLPIFVLGLPRSGTSLTEQILASHPSVYGAGELNDIGNIAFSLGSKGITSKAHEYLKIQNQKSLDHSAIKYLTTLNKLAPGATRVVNKMPTDFWYIGLISLLFPEAKIIHMIRDPLDTCLSMYFQRFGSTMSFTTDLTELSEYYIAYSSIMKYWKRVLSIDILDINYEDLVINQEQVSKKIIDFCNLEWDEQCLNFYKTKRDVHTPSYDQVRKPMYNKSISRWKNYTKELSPLIKALENIQE